MSPVDVHQISILALGQVLANLGIGIVAPVLPSLAAELGIGATGIGAIIAAPSVARVICNLPAGVVADRFGRVPVMVGGEAAVALGIIGFAQAPNLASMLVLRLVLGAGSCASAAGAQAYAADITGKPHLLKYRGIIIGVQSAAVGVAYTAGPALGGLLVELVGARFAYGVVGWCTLACAAVFTRLPETVDRRRKAATAQSQTISGEAWSACEAWRVLLRDPAQQATLVGEIALSANYALSMVIVPLFATKLGASPSSLGLIFAAGAAASAAVCPLGGWLSDRIGRARLVVPSLGLMAASCGAMFLCGDLTSLSAGYVAWSAAEGLLLPAIYAYAADCVPSDKKAQAFSLHRMGADIAYVITPLLLGALADAGGPASACGATALATAGAMLLFKHLARAAVSGAAPSAAGQRAAGAAAEQRPGATAGAPCGAHAAQ